MDQIFRSIFGLSRRDDMRNRNLDRKENLPFESDERDEDNSHNSPPYFDGGNMFLFTNPADVVRQFDEMFASFDRVFQGLGSFNTLELPPSDHYQTGDDTIPDSVPNMPGYGLAPRDNMLKHPDSLESDQFFPHGRKHHERHRNWFNNFWRKPPTEEDKLDSDVDDSVRHGGLDSLFSKRANDEMDSSSRHEVVPHRGTVFRGVTVQTHCSADGKVTETRKTVDGEGNEQTVVTRSMNGQTIRQTTKRNKRGETEVTEDLINMNENDKAKFDEKWNFSPSHASPSMQPRNDVLRSFEEDRAEDQSIFARLFGKDIRGF